MATIPESFKQQIKAFMPDEAEALLKALATGPAVSIRLNRRKAELTDKAADAVPWCPSGSYLDCRPQFTFDPLLHAGCYYVQDASSMFISHVLRHVATGGPVTYLDLCAAPGGKTTAAIDALPDGSLVVANEIDGRRAQILRENVVKWGYPHCVVTNSDASHLGRIEATFDIIAADMPCSGEGMFRKDDEAVSQWTPALVEQCSTRQREIATDIWRALKPGGIFIYSTCTFNRKENEEMVDFIISSLGATPVDIPTVSSWRIHEGIGTAYPCYRFMPHMTRGEGLFMAVMRKDGKPTATANTKKDKNKSRKMAAKPEAIPQWLSEQESYALKADEAGISAVAKCHLPLIEQITKVAKTLQTGIAVATIKGRDLIPTQALAQSTALRSDAFPVIDVDYPSAIAYLRGEAVTLPVGSPRGFAIIAYRSNALGFVKNLGNRANNLYPKEWRIRSGYVPDAAPSVI